MMLPQVLPRCRPNARFGSKIHFKYSIRHKSSSLSRYGLGGHHWKRFSPESYQGLIREALSRPNPVSYLEVAGQEGGDIAMVGAIQSAIERSPELAHVPLTITTRIGYRTLQGGDAAQKIIPGSGDVVVTENGSETTTPGSNVVHNISSEFIQESLQSSPLLELESDMKNLNLVYLLHNPEVQVLELLRDSPDAKQDERRAFVQNRWTPALQTLQEYAMAHGSTSSTSTSISFGVVSNGLGIPAGSHPMHMDVESVISAAQNYDRFSTVQLPANLLERHGWDVAREIHSAVPNVCIAAMRPWTCYPDMGTGTGHPFRLVDYALPSLDGEQHPYVPFLGNDTGGPMAPVVNSTQYTHQMTGVPAIYQIALQTAMSHFDAEELLQLKQERELTVDERETIDGCKLVQSMLHDLDTDLEHIRSFAAHEEQLYGRIIPLLYDTFEALDDQTSDVLQAYFAAYAVAVRYAIAKKTRQILKEGDNIGTSSSSPTYTDIPSSMSLQEYAARHLMADPCINRIVIGASTIQDFRHQTEIIEKISMEESPLDAIVKANQELEMDKAKEQE